MRSLVILRGCPGCGKSTWIKNNKLKNYTLSSDSIRLLVQSPVLGMDGPTITQKNDSYVWELLMELLEKRMQHGDFTVIEATHGYLSEFHRYDQLCEKYCYKRFYVDFSDVSIETCIEHNKKREAYKRVPDGVIEKIYSRLRTPDKVSGWVEIDKDKFWDEMGVKLSDFNGYERINIFGDICGCSNPLKEYFTTFPFSENEMYIFCGDYVGGGIQNKETLEFLMELSKHKNTLFLEGKSDKCLNYYSLDDDENIESKNFLDKFEDIDKKLIRQFYRKLDQMAYFTFDDQIYFVTHGGLPHINVNLQLVSTEQFIDGVEDENVNIDEIWANNNSADKYIQIHGHRNTYEIDDVDELSYNLEGKVESGGNLKVLQIQKGLKPNMVKIKNNAYSAK